MTAWRAKPGRVPVAVLGAGRRASIIAAAAAALLFHFAAVAQVPVECALLEHRWPQGTPAPMSFWLPFVDGRVARVAFRSAGGMESAIELAPLRPGISWRSVLLKSPGEPEVWRAVFNLATVEPAGTVLLETWLRQTNRPAEEVHLWTKLRCAPQG